MQDKRNTFLSFFFIILLWQSFVWWRGENIFFPSFTQVITETFSLVQEKYFGEILLRTLLRVLFGFFLCFTLSFFLAFFAFWKRNLEIIWKAFFHICRILPAVILIVLLLLFFPISWLPFCIQLCVVLPLLYEQSLKSLQGMDREYRQFLHYYHVSLWKKFRYVYFPIVFRGMYKNLESILGLCMKVTIAGELLAQEDRAIGGEIFTEKMYLNIPRVLAWCLILLILHGILSFAMRKLGNKDE